MTTQKEDLTEESNLNVGIQIRLIRKAKAKAAILGIDLKEYISRVLEEDTKNISEDLE